MAARVSAWQLWSKAKPWQRRNLVLSGLALFWAGALYVSTCGYRYSLWVLQAAVRIILGP